ncbi:unnamed protein product [Meganyctiphanes norvegica]|uniref:Uncharacterized protein n=1 Tax=Meganyctiphanes norvegica TaxID=48144 RepID=A0AAV2RP27_MEGNR
MPSSLIRVDSCGLTVSLELTYLKKPLRFKPISFANFFSKFRLSTLSILLVLFLSRTYSLHLKLLLFSMYLFQAKYLCLNARTTFLFIHGAWCFLGTDIGIHLSVTSSNIFLKHSHFC